MSRGQGRPTRCATCMIQQGAKGGSNSIDGLDQGRAVRGAGEAVPPVTFVPKKNPLM